MIKSKFTNIESSLSNAPEVIRASEISYIDYKTDLMPDYNSFYPIIHKDVAHSYKEEVRFIHQIMPPIGWQYDWETEEVEEGKYINADINVLIDEIIVAPFAPNRYFQLIKNLCSAYSLKQTH
ncbi:hypothetical protein BH11BAC3_BH11BAC3_11210 [soil metagenome]